jgi:hypothetical protein
VACVAGEPKSPDPVRLVFALGSQAAHAQRLPGDRPVPVLAAGTSDNVPVLVLVAALLARDQKPRHWSNINNRTRRTTILKNDLFNKMNIINYNNVQARNITERSGRDQKPAWGRYAWPLKVTPERRRQAFN